MEKIEIVKKEENVKIITWLISLYLLLAPLDFLPVISGVSLSRMMILIPLSVWLLYLRYEKLYLDRYFIVLVLYVTMAIITTLYSFDVSATMQRVVTLTMNIAAILLLSMIHYSEKEMNIMKRAVVYSGWLTLVLMIFYSKMDLYGGLRLTVMVNGIYQDPNYLTGFLIFAMVFYYDDFIKNRKKTSLVKLIVFFVFVLLTGSRGGMIAILGAIIFYTLIWIIDNEFKLSSILKTTSIILLFSVFFILAKEVLPEAIINRFNISSVLESGGAGRTTIWKTIIEQYNSLPIFNQLFGAGAGTVKYFSGGAVAHNIWLENLIEIGLIGTIIVFCFYYFYLKNACQMKEYVVAASMFGYVIMGLTMSLYSYKPIWNIVFLIMIQKNNKIQTMNSDISNNGIEN